MQLQPGKPQRCGLFHLIFNVIPLQIDRPEPPQPRPRFQLRRQPPIAILHQVRIGRKTNRPLDPAVIQHTREPIESAFGLHRFGKDMGMMCEDLHSQKYPPTRAKINRNGETSADELTRVLVRSLLLNEGAPYDRNSTLPPSKSSYFSPTPSF